MWNYIKQLFTPTAQIAPSSLAPRGSDMHIRNGDPLSIQHEQDALRARTPSTHWWSRLWGGPKPKVDTFTPIIHIMPETFAAFTALRIDNVEPNSNPSEHTLWQTINTLWIQSQDRNAPRLMGLDPNDKIRIMQPLGTAPNVVLYFYQHDEEGNRMNHVRNITISSEYLNTFEAFHGRINQIAEGKLYGSDAFSPFDHLTLECNHFNLEVVDATLIQHGKGKKPRIDLIYETLFPDVESNCWSYVIDELCDRQYTKANELKALIFNKITDGKASTLTECLENFKEGADIKPYLSCFNCLIHLNHLKTTFEFRVSMCRNPENIKARAFIEKNTTKKGLVYTDTYYRLKYGDIIDDTLDMQTIPEEIKSVYAYKEDCQTCNILSTDEHIDIISQDLDKESPLNVYMSFKSHYLFPHEGITAKGKKTITFDTPKTRDIERMNGLEPTYIKKYIYFDYETVIDYAFYNVMIPYSMSYLVLLKNDYDRLALAQDIMQGLEKATDEQIVLAKEFINSLNDRAKCIVGFDCNETFAKVISQESYRSQITFIGFNNTYFDNFILIDWMKKNKQHWVSDVCYANGGILTAKIMFRHDLFDVHKHLTVGGLASLCRSFKIELPKMKFDHYYDAQVPYEECPTAFIESMKNNKELIEYNKRDVVCLALLMARYNDALANIEGFKRLAENITDTATVGSTMFKRFNNFISDYNKKHEEAPIMIPRFKATEIDIYRKMLKYKCAGRCDLYNGSCIIKEEVVSLDICSAYPYNLAVGPNYYPAGYEMIPLKRYEDRGYATDDKGNQVLRIAYFDCDVDQSNLEAQNLPFIYPRKLDGCNDWTLKKPIAPKDYEKFGYNPNEPLVLHNYFLSSIMIDYMRSKGVKITTYAGIEFQHVIRGHRLFEPLIGLMKAKMQQDTYKQTKDPKYNQALRETIKLLSNSISGKVIEGLHVDKVDLIHTMTEYIKLQEQTHDTGGVSTINVLGNDLLIQYKVSEESIFTQQRPIFYGCLCYDYTRNYIWEHILSKIPKEALIYTDTDSVKVLKSAYNKWLIYYGSNQIVPHDPEVELMAPEYKDFPLCNIDREKTSSSGYTKYKKVYGSFEDEYSELNEEHSKHNNLSMHMQKKSYLIGYMNPDNGDVEVFKGKLKGVGIHDLYLPKDTYDIETMTDDLQELNEFYNEHQDELRLGYIDDKDPTKTHYTSNFYKLAVEFMKTGKVHVMCSSLTKSLKNSKKGVKPEEKDRYNATTEHIKLRIIIKTLTKQASQEEP